MARITTSGEYRCDGCDRSFSTSQALGGHMSSASHKNKAKGVPNVLLQDDRYKGKEPGSDHSRSLVDTKGTSETEHSKEVPTGPKYQAVILGWRVQDIKHSERLMGSVIRMPNSEAFVSDNDCTCQDKGSVRCVRQHIKDARARLRLCIGDGAFTEMGFCETGEGCAKTWHAGEEEIFREVVSAARKLFEPKEKDTHISSKKQKYWDAMSVVFPTRTKETLSYYYNVYKVQRKREKKLGSKRKKKPTPTSSGEKALCLLSSERNNNMLEKLNADSNNEQCQSSKDGEHGLRTTENAEERLVLDFKKPPAIEGGANCEASDFVTEKWYQHLNDD